VRLFFAAFLPPILEDGVAFEAHPQNTIARFSLAAPHELRGFVIRDFGGLHVHPAYSSRLHRCYAEHSPGQLGRYQHAG
jgi:siderophore synthetase component